MTGSADPPSAIALVRYPVKALRVDLQLIYDSDNGSDDNDSELEPPFVHSELGWLHRAAAAFPGDL